MDNFRLGSLIDWQRVENGEMVLFPIPAAGYRNVEVEVMTNAQLSVYAGAPDAEQPVLVGCGVGHFQINFATNVDCVMGFYHDADSADVFMKTRLASQAVPDSGEATFTMIEPRRAEAPEITQMRQMMYANRIQMALDLARQREENDRAEALIERAKPQEAAPAPAAAPAQEDPAK